MRVRGWAIRGEAGYEMLLRGSKERRLREKAGNGGKRSMKRFTVVEGWCVDD